MGHQRIVPGTSCDFKSAHLKTRYHHAKSLPNRSWDHSEQADKNQKALLTNVNTNIRNKCFQNIKQVKRTTTSKHKAVFAKQSCPHYFWGIFSRLSFILQESESMDVWLHFQLCWATLSDADFCVGNVWVTQSFFVVHTIFVRAPRNVKPNWRRLWDHGWSSKKTSSMSVGSVAQR